MSSVPSTAAGSREKDKGAKKDKQLVFRTSFRNTILDVLLARGYKEADEGEKWDFNWADVGWIRQYMGKDGGHLDENQHVNHFPNHFELTRKDNLTKNMKRARKLLEREGRGAEAAKYDFVPLSFVLPGEYGPFLEEFKKGFGNYEYDNKNGIDNRELNAEKRKAKSSNTWIMKPVGGRQGKGIFLFNKLSEIADWKKGVNFGESDGQQPDAYLAQQYIQDPYLVAGRKFDLRLYALVTSYVPLTVWLSRTGFARFSNHRFSMASSDIKNAYVHLTNVAIQCTDANYNSEAGCKWSLHSLRQYMISQHGMEATNACFHEMQNVIIRSLLAVQKVMINDKNCFELYGYDMMIDQKLRPYLIEVNASPSISADTADDYELKFGVLDDLLTIVDMEKNLTGKEEHVGSFDLVYKGTPVKGPPSQEITSYLGCENHHGLSMRTLHRMYGAEKVGSSMGCQMPTAKLKAH